MPPKAQSGIARFDRELAPSRPTPAASASALDALKGELDERLKGAAKAADLAPVATKLAPLEQDLQSLPQERGERTAAQRHARVLLALEIANLKRAMDRGERYVEELDARQEGRQASTLDLAPLERYMPEGAADTARLAKYFRRVADAAMLTRKPSRADASVLDRLVSGARSIVRVRKAGHDRRRYQPGGHGRPHGGRAQGRPSRRGAGRRARSCRRRRHWPPMIGCKKVEARQAVDQAMADIEAQLKSSLAGQSPYSATEPKR